VDLIKVEGFDSMINPVTGEICDALDAGIVDPLLVTKTALMSAVSAATQLISTRKYIYSENA
jgi:chaperonin GroEL